MAISGTDLLEVPTIYFWPIFQGISQQNMAKHMVRLRTSMYWILKFPLNRGF